MVFGSLPRCCDRRSQIGRQSSALDELLPRGQHFSLVHPGSSEVTKFETRALTGLVINHRNAGCLSQLPSSSRKAQLQTAKGTRTAGALIEQNTCHACHEDSCAIRPNIPSSVRFPDVLCGSLAPPIGRSLHFLATWRKGGVQRSE